MICYQCICEDSTATHMACAVCSRCGGGACERHVVESGRTHSGLSGAAQTWLICTRCYYGDTSVAAQAEKAVYMRAEEGAVQKFFARLPWKRQCQEPAQEPVLPSANEAVETVEAFLRMIKVEVQDILVEETEDTSRELGGSES
ncbi:hypothetical protein [Ktedonobacter robiniae]|uniref:DUF2180 family protein n=1 Tax=Ktedonobacter robiniae TaxID=2778365 RepID=A0ABQ3UZ44_9CHLR|nr:hypothetical protein [Ktedonobacter robiniae]GHO57975.1 hypothetical protein KSB_64500 [Ktedonobacter robiniae]